MVVIRKFWINIHDSSKCGSEIIFLEFITLTNDKKSMEIQDKH
jgi:hypothetical protein